MGLNLNRRRRHQCSDHKVGLQIARFSSQSTRSTLTYWWKSYVESRATPMVSRSSGKQFKDVTLLLLDVFTGEGCLRPLGIVECECGLQTHRLDGGQ